MPILGHPLAMDNPNPECSDLGKLTKALENTIAKLPKSKVVCKTNTNCTGKMKSFNIIKYQIAPLHLIHFKAKTVV